MNMQMLMYFRVQELQAKKLSLILKVNKNRNKGWQELFTQYTGKCITAGNKEKGSWFFVSIIPRAFTQEIASLDHSLTLSLMYLDTRFNSDHA